MLSGFNTNVRYRGVVFHVQTEDSGRDNPSVVTHLFYGGNIMASVKSTYRDKLESDTLEAEVRALMEGQHKTVLRRLKSGEYDAGIESRLGSGAWADATDTAATLPPDAPQEPAVASPPPAKGETPKEQIARVFGDGVVSQKPLDEVVLDYLVENARKRKRPRPK
jgi:hypothetical protein